MWEGEIAQDGPDVGVTEERRHRVCKERQPHDQEDALRARVVAEDRHRPDRDQGHGYCDVAGDSEDFHRSAHTRELANRETGVGDEQQAHCAGARAQRELLTDQRAQALACIGAESRAHLLHDDEPDRYEHHQEQGSVAELSTGARIREDPAGVVAGVSCDQSGAKHREERQHPC